MRNIVLILSVLILVPDAYAVEYGALTRAAKSFLTPQKFPTVFNDADFTTRMQVLADGYDEFDAEYDENGRCISGCAYQGITIEEEEEMMQRAAREMRMLIEAENTANATVVSSQAPQPQQQAQVPSPVQAVPQELAPSGGAVVTAVIATACVTVAIFVTTASSVSCAVAAFDDTVIATGEVWCAGGGRY